MTALSAVDLALKPGVFTVISGPSGSGKTSLISVLGALITPDSGAVLFEDSDITKLAPDRRSTFRREKVGYIFQSFRLMPALNAEENIRLSLNPAGRQHATTRSARARDRRPGRQGAFAARPDVARRKTARRRRTGHRTPPDHGAGRRAHRQPRCRQRSAGHGPARRDRARQRAHRGGRHP